MRTQSKQLSSKIRDRVAREKHRQLRNVEETKRRELLTWTEKHVNNSMANYYYCLSNVGDAHAAAERENQLAEQLGEQQRRNRQIAVRRGRDALHKERLANSKKNERKPKISSANKRVPTTTLTTMIASEDDKLLSIDDSDEELIVDGQGSTAQSLEKRLDEMVGESTGSKFLFTQVSDLIEERQRVRNLCDQILESETGTSQPEIHSESAEQKSAKANAIARPSHTKWFHAPKSPQAKPLRMPKSPKQRSPVKNFVTKSPARKGLNAHRNLNENVTTKVISPNKLDKSKTVVSSSKFVSPQRREFVPRFNKPGILKNKVTQEASKPMTTVESPEKVQFYDHFSRYGKEYDPVPGMVLRESLVPAMNANEAARLQNEVDELRFKQLEELKYV